MVIFYALPMIIAAISSYFALKLAGELLMANLINIYILSLVICLVIFVIYGVVSVRKFKRIIYDN